MNCSFGWPLFNLDDNATKEIIHRLVRFQETYEPYHGYVCVAICVFGIFTNFINVIVLTKRQMRTSVNVLLTGIAVCDMGTMASYLVYIIHFVFADQNCNPSLYSYGWMLFLLCHIISSVALHTTGLWLAVVMAFVRNMTLRQAMNGSKWLRSRNTWKICLIVYACAFLLCIPSGFGNSIVEYASYYNDTCGAIGRTHDRFYTSYTIDIPENRCFMYTITLWLTGTVFKIIPCLLLAILITILVWTIKKAERRRRALFESNSTNHRARIRLRQQHQEIQTGQLSSLTRSDRTSTMLVVILCLFLLTELPQGAISILSGIYVADMRLHVYPNLGDILDLLSLINSSVNFILYCSMSSKYRQVFWQVVLPRKLYIRWFLRPRSSLTQAGKNSPSQQSQAMIAGGARRGTRPELHLLATVANTANKSERRPSEQETIIIDLYNTAREEKQTEACENESVTSSSSRRGSSTRGSFRKKKTSGDLRRQALTNAAVLAATPAIAVPPVGDSDQGIQPDEGELEPGRADNVVSSTAADKSPSESNLKRHRWLISCSCLCDCACRSGQTAVAAADGQRVSSPTTYGTNGQLLARNRDPPDVIPAIDTDQTRSPYSPARIWSRCSGAGQSQDCVFV